VRLYLSLPCQIWIKPFPDPLPICYELYKLWTNIVRARETVEHVRQLITNRILH